MSEITFNDPADVLAPETEAPAPIKLPKLKRPELLDVSEQLAVMLDAGVRLADALETCREQAERDGQARVAAVLADVAADVSAGTDLSAALARHPASFPNVYVALVKAGEKSGLMTDMIGRAVGYLRDEREVVRKVKGAMTYPAVMLGFALVTTIGLLTFVLPRFTAMYAGKEDRLPGPTKLLVAISDVLTTQWHLLIPGTALVVFVTWRWLRTDAGTQWWHATQLRLPILGPMYRKLHLSRGLRMLGTLGGAGVGLVDCLDTARELATNVWYAALWEDVAEQIRAGRPVSEPLRDTELAASLVPPSVAQMIRAGEGGGQLATTAEKIAGHAERELRETVDQVTRLIEPAMIVLMGGLIGGITMALLLPVFTVGRVVAE